MVNTTTTTGGHIHRFNGRARGYARQASAARLSFHDKNIHTRTKPSSAWFTPLPTDTYFGLTTEVVSGPLSTYVPLKNQSSAPVPSLPGRGSLKMPKCQSAPLLDVLAAKGPAVLTSVLLPVECQNVTWPAAKFCSVSRNLTTNRLRTDSRSHRQHCATRSPSAQPSTCSAPAPSIADSCCSPPARH